MHSSIDKVRDRKKNDALLIDGINYGRVVAMQTYNSSFRSIIKEILRLFAFDYKIETTGNKDSNICLLYSLKGSNRADYNEIIDLFKQAVKDIRYVDLIQYKSFKKLFKKTFLLIKSFINFKLNKVEDSLIVAIVATQYIILRDSLQKFKLFEGLDMVCTFCDAHGPDNLFTQIANTRGITTVTLQHGQYRILSLGNEIPDAEAYENFISDYMLTWGQATVDEFKNAGINTNRLVKVGALKSFSFNKRISKQDINGVFGIVLSGEPYRKTNVAMINLANTISEKYKLKYFIRMHPRNNKSFYMKYCKMEYLSGVSSNIENTEYAQRVDFSLIHMTGVFVELLSINSPIFVYKDSVLERIFQIEPFCIESMNDFDILYSVFLNSRNKILDEQYDMYKYFNESGNIKNNYQNAINNIIERR